jgi:phosphate transport system protein
MEQKGMDLNIETLKNYTVKMMEKCEELVIKSVEAMVAKDLDASREVIKQDDEIDALRDYIRERSIELIALRQPMAKDLRAVYALGTIALELERIGDYAVNIAMETIKIGKEEHVEPLIDIPKMSNICADMLRRLKDALILGDDKLAYAIALEDDIVDNLYNDVYIDALAAMHRDSRNINQGVKLLAVGRYLERIGDHITNICESIIYTVSGEMIEFD